MKAQPDDMVLPREERARQALEALRTVIPSPQTELEFADPYQLIVAVVLSAQCTDERVNRTTPAFFEAFPTLADLAEATPEQVYPLIRSISYPNNKARHLAAMARQVMDAFGGRIPDTVDELMKLPGVGRKTAQVVAAVAFDVAALPVDTHVFRVANRIGLVQDADTPYRVEMQLKDVIPQAEWDEAHHLLILHGRYTCMARAPQCERCPVRPVCLYYQELLTLPAPLTGLSAKKGKYYCGAGDHYFDEPTLNRGPNGTDQLACPVDGSINIYVSKTGVTTQRVRDYRIT